MRVFLLVALLHANPFEGCPPAPSLDGGRLVAMGSGFQLLDHKSASQGAVVFSDDRYVFKTAKGAFAGAVTIERRIEQTKAYVTDCNGGTVGQLSLREGGDLRVYDASGVEVARGGALSAKGLVQNFQVRQQGEHYWHVSGNADGRLIVAAVALSREQSKP